MFYKLISLSFLLACFSLNQSCEKDSKKPKPANDPELTRSEDLDTTGLPKAIFNFNLNSQKCRNILNFVEAYQKKYLPEVTLVVEGECKASADGNQLERQVEFLESGESMGTLVFRLNSRPLIDSLEQKPEAIATSSSTSEHAAEDLDKIAATYQKWVEENSLTTRDACSMLAIAIEDCKEPMSSL